MYFDVQTVDSAIRAIYERQKLPGVSVCVKDKDGIVFEQAYGFRDVGMSVPTDRDTMFGIASMSKSITALALCILETEGKVRWEDPVVRFFPDFKVTGNPRDTVTLFHLATHTAGIPPMEPLEWSIAMNSKNRDSEEIRALRATAPNDMSTIDQIIDYIGNCGYTTLGAAGEYMSYCNEGYAILSYVVDMVAGIPLERFCEERIFRPLGMTRTIMDDDCVSARALSGGNITALFETVDDSVVGDENWSILPPFRGCAMVKSTAPDMASYYRCLASRGMHEGNQVIPAAAVERLIGAGFAETPQDVYCLGLNKFTRFGHVFCEHAGGLHGVSTKGALLKDEGVGFAVLCNHGDADMDDILWVLYSAALDLPLDTCFRRFVPNGETFSEPEMLVGYYLCHEGNPEHLAVTLEDGVLYGEKVGVRETLRWCGATRFLGFAEGSASPSRKAEFLVRDGQAWAVRVGTRVYVREPQ